MSKFGLYDTKDACWLGDDKGPLVYEDDLLAMCAARILDARFNNPAGRIKVTWLPEGILWKKYDVTPQYSAEEILKMLSEAISFFS
jgi:hypothetical protein